MSNDSPRLQIIQANGFKTEIPIDRDLLRIGRSNEADIVINEKAASRLHAEISNLDGECYLKDLESRNGTFLNEAKVTEERLRNNATFRIGNTTFVFIDPKDTGDPAIAADLSDDDWDNLGATASKPKEKEGDPGSLLSPLNLLMIVGAVAVIGGVGFLYVIARQEPEAIDQIPIPLPLPSNAWYGFMDAGNRTHPDRVIFSFQADGDKPLEASFKVWDIDRPDELAIVLNGNPLLVPEQSGHATYSPERTLPLPVEYLKQGENLLTFDNQLVPAQQPHEFYGVGSISIGEPRRYVCRPEEAEEDYILGKRDYESRNISKDNLFNAVQRLQRAIDNARSCEAKPTFYVELTTLYRQANEEHEQAIEKLWFCHDQSLRTRDVARSVECLNEILDRVPDPLAEDNIRAVRELRKLQQQQPNP